MGGLWLPENARHRHRRAPKAHQRRAELEAQGLAVAEGQAERLAQGLQVAEVGAGPEAEIAARRGLVPHWWGG